MSAPPQRRGRTRSVREAAEEIGVPQKRVRAWIHSGELPARWCGNKYRMTDVALQHFIDSFDQQPQH
ncbi:excisionase family DNA binding protein [Pseudonocardia sediminis]|uniref:Excisionase family DNA binding protein n=1 Tax=Pseudonocardia sediminis TaxID=1397368 RepID=A0A4Q7V2G4_PSEST|nr:excisionase family DNA binding protein [Pseudonocardia sediminis]